MAIQVRRGNYADLDRSKLVQGEPFVTLDNAPDGTPFIGMAIAPNKVVRLANYDELVDVKTDCEQYRDDAHDSATAAATSEVNALDSAKDSEAWAVGERGGLPVPDTDDTYENNSKYYAEFAGEAWENIDNAMQIVTPTLSIDFTTGIMSYTGSFFDFVLNRGTGHLEWGIAV